MSHWSKILLSSAAIAALSGSVVFADANAAKGYVKEALQLIEGKELDSAASKLELAEAELDGVDGGAKIAIVASINEAKGKIVSAKASLFKPKYTRELDNLIRSAESDIGNLVTWPGTERQITELFANADAQAAIPDEIAAAKKKFATFKKLNDKKAAAAHAEQLESQIKRLEEQWAETQETLKGDSPSSKDRAIDRMGDSLGSINKTIAKLDATEDPIKSLKGRADKIGGEFTKIALGEKVKEQVETLNRQVELYKNEWDGWQAETKVPTYAQMQKETGEAIGRLLMPKTAALISRHGAWLDGLKENANYQLVSSAPEVKAIVEKATADRNTAVAKAVKVATGVVDDAEKAGVREEADLSRVKDAVRLTLGEESPEAKALIARMEKKIAAHEAATTGAEEAKTKLITDLRAKAEAAWPKLYEGMPYSTDIDLPNQVGKPIGFLSDNLTGYRFKPGDFYFTTTLGGAPVAATIDPALMKQIKETEEKIGRSLGDDDNDGKWDVIAVVTNKKVKLLAKREVEATGKIDGADVKITGEYAEPVEATVINIIAAKCGPFAGAKDRGVLKLDGTVGK